MEGMYLYVIYSKDPIFNLYYISSCLQILNIWIGKFWISDSWKFKYFMSQSTIFLNTYVLYRQHSSFHLLPYYGTGIFC